MYFTRLGSSTQPWVGLVGRRPTTWELGPPALFQTEILLSTPSHDPTGEEPGCGGPRLAWLHVVCGCEVGWTYGQIESGQSPWMLSLSCFFAQFLKVYLCNWDEDFCFECFSCKGKIVLLLYCSLTPRFSVSAGCQPSQDVKCDYPYSSEYLVVFTNTQHPHTHPLCILILCIYI